jgi:hypothetical protein
MAIIVEATEEGKNERTLVKVTLQIRGSYNGSTRCARSNRNMSLLKSTAGGAKQVCTYETHS